MVTADAKALVTEGDQPSGALVRWLPSVVVVPFLVSAVSALVQHWVPVSDGAAIVVTSRDLARGHVPLLGISSSLSEVGGGDVVYHPGPMLYWVLAPATWLLGPIVGTIVSVSTVQATAAAGAVVVARRSGSRALTIGAAITVLVVAVTVFGPGRFYDPFNTPLPALVLLFVYLASWRLVVGDHAVAPVAVLAASFCVQVHLTYAVPVAVVLIPCLVVAFGPARWHAGPTRPSRATVVATALVAAGCWSGPLVEAVTNGGGNLLALASGSGGTFGRVGLVGAGWVLVNMVALPHVQVGIISDATFRRGPGPVGLVMGALVTWAVVRGARRTSVEGRRLLVVAGLAVLGAMVDAALLPDEPLEAPQLTWFKVVVPFAVLAVAGSHLLTRPPPVRRWPGVLALALVVAVASLPFPIRTSLDADRWLYDAVPTLSGELRATLDPSDAYRLRSRGGVRFELLQHALMADLDGHGWDLGVTARNRTYFGDHRVLSAGPEVTDLVVGPAGAPPPGDDAERVATFRPRIDEVARRRVERALRRWAIERGPFELTAEGENRLGALLEEQTTLSAAEVEAVVDRPEEVLDLDPSVAAELYRNQWVAQPALDGSLAADMRRHLGPTAVDVWAVPSTSSA